MKLRTHVNLIVASLSAAFVVLAAWLQFDGTRRAVREEIAGANVIATQLLTRILVTYAFGDRLPASGRCITVKGELTKLAKNRRRLACYVVEVCPSCSWNHLARTFLLGTA